MRSPRDCPSVIWLTKAEHHSETQHSGTSCCWVTQSCPTLCDPKYTWLLCPPSPGACSNSCSLSRWCHPTISSSVTPFSSCLQSFQASGSFPMSQFLASGGQSTGDSALASILPMNIQNRFPLGWTGLTPCCPRDSEKSSPTPQFKSINSSALSFFYGST